MSAPPVAALRPFVAPLALVLASRALAHLALAEGVAGQALAAGAHTPAFVVALVLASLAARLAEVFVAPALLAVAVVGAAGDAAGACALAWRRRRAERAGEAVLRTADRAPRPRRASARSRATLGWPPGSPGSGAGS